MKRIRLSYWLILGILTALWLVADPILSSEYEFFRFRGSLVNYTGILGIGAMSVAMVLAIRSVRIESVLGGLDKSYRLHKWLGITGLVTNSTSYDYDEVLNSHPHYKKVVTLDCVEGWSATILWEGVLVRDLLAEADPMANAEVVIFHAYDGYTTSLPIDYIMDNDILMAYKMNDVVLPPERGFPFQLVAESKWGYKWIKWITEIELSDDVGYRGYWESRGYSNSADLDRSFFGD